MIVGLRWEIGGDWHSYLLFFKWSKLISFYQVPELLFEPSYFLLNKYSPNFTTMNLLCALISLALIAISARVIGVTSINLFLLLSFSIFPILLLCGYVRQGIAASFFCLAFTLLIFKKKWFLPLILVFFGLTFHNPIKRVMMNSLAAYLPQVEMGDISGQELNKMPGENAGNISYNSKGVKFRILFTLALIAMAFVGAKFYKINLDPIYLRISTLYISYSVLALVTLMILPGLSAAVDRVHFYTYPFIFLLITKQFDTWSKSNAPKNPIEASLIAMSIVFLAIWILFSDYSKYYTSI